MRLTSRVICAAIVSVALAGSFAVGGSQAVAGGAVGSVSPPTPVTAAAATGVGVPVALTPVEPVVVVDSAARLGVSGPLATGRIYQVVPALPPTLPAGGVSSILVQVERGLYPPPVYLWDSGPRPAQPSVAAQDLALVPLAPDGSFRIEVATGSSSSLDLTIDLLAYGLPVPAGNAAVVPVTPTLLKALPRVSSTFQVAGVAGVPTDAKAALLTVENSYDFYATAADAPVHGVALRRGAALLAVALSATGEVTVSANVSTRVTVVGYLTSGRRARGELVPTIPKAIYPSGNPKFYVTPGQSVTIPVSGHWGVPTQGVTAALVYLGSKGQQRDVPWSGLAVQLHPSGHVASTLTDVDYPEGLVRLVRLGADGAIEVTASDQTGGAFSPRQVVLVGYLTGSAPLGPLRVLPRPLAPASVGVPYTSAPLLTADARLVTTSLAGGVLPPGLVLADDTVSGIPRTAGDYHFALVVTDAVGNEHRVAQDLTVSPAVLDGAAIQVATGLGAACALTATRHVFCWGSWLKDEGRRYGPIADISLTPREVTGLPEPATKVAVMDYGGCALGVSRHVYCWYGDWSVVPPSELPRMLPEKYSDIVGTGRGTICGTTSNGQVNCFGHVSRRFGKRGISGLPGRVTLLGGSCGVTSASPTTLWCWDRGASAASALAGPPRLVAPYDAVRGTCVLSAGRVECYDSYHRTWVVRAVGASRLADSGECAVVAGAATCWGPQTASTVVALGGLAVADVQGQTSVFYAQTGVTCAVVVGGAVWCSGDNSLGQLGSGSYTATAAPVRVLGLH